MLLSDDKRIAELTARIGKPSSSMSGGSRSRALTMSRACAALVAFLLLSSCEMPEQEVTVLKCGGTPLDENFRCPIVQRQGSELSFLINPATQKVQLTVIESNGDFLAGQNILDNCSVVDSHNWKCTDRFGNGQAQFVSTYGMFRGHFYYTITSPDPPNYYSSSVGGWRRLAVKYGVMSIADAQKFE